MVDILAGHVRDQPYDQDRIQLPAPQWQQVFPHLSTFLRQDICQFDRSSDTVRIPFPALPTPHACTEPEPSVTQSLVRAEVLLQVATANVQSLYSGDTGGKGKIDYLQEQFSAAQLHVVGLQETRGTDGCWSTKSWLRISAGGNKGNYGTELWVNLRLPYGTSEGQALRFRKSHFAVVFKEPRRMLVRVEAPGIQTWILVCHAPHGGATEHERESWWNETSVLLTQHSAQDNCIVCIDANATTGETFIPYIDSQSEPENHSTALFRDFLQRSQLYVPATDARLGPFCPTWTSPNGQVEHRLDYVLVPMCLQPSCCCCFTGLGIDLNFHDKDHRLTGVKLCWSTHVRQPRPQLDKWSYSRACIQHTQQLSSCLSNSDKGAWDQDVEKHHEIVNASVGEALTQWCPRKSEGPRKSFIAPEVWKLRQTVLATRRSLRQVGLQAKRAWLKFCFAHWHKHSGHGLFCTRVVPKPPDACTGLRSLAIVLQLRRQAKELKTAVKSSKLQALHQALEPCHAETPAAEILKLLRPFKGSSNAKFFGPPPLPLVNDKYGEVCPTPEAALNRWIEFFASMEGGQRISPEDLRNRWCQELHEDVVPCNAGTLEDVPTQVALEATMRRVKANKAIGPDQVPGEICRWHPCAMSEIYFPILLKTVLFGMEPLPFKGGTLTMAWKKKGPQRECSSYRSLLVSSHAGKACHRAMRDMNYADFERALHVDQLGGRRGTPVGLAMHLVRAHQRIVHEQQRSHGIIFLDLREAFYRTLRELAIGTSPGDLLSAWVRGLSLPDDTLLELEQLLQQPCATAHAGFSDIHRHSVQALHQCTWFAMRDQTDRVLTSIGSRPGDCYADWVFGILFSRVLRRLEDRLNTLGLLDSFAIAPAAALQEPDFTGPQECFVGPTWMDDLAICVSSEEAQTLVSKTAKILSELLSLCRAHGMQPNLAEGKTEVMVHLRGPGSSTLRKQFFNIGGRPFIDVVTNEGVEAVHITPKYKHLGGILHHTGSELQELKHRFAQAHQAVADHRRLIFRNKHFTQKQRMAMFDSLVLSKLLYGMESLILQKPADVTTADSMLFRLYRRLSSRPHDAHMSHSELLADLEVPDFVTLQRRSRLRYFSTLFRCATPKVWGLLSADRAWNDAVRADLSWMWRRLLLSDPLPDPSEDIQPWQHLAAHRPKYWKKLVGRATLAEILHRKNQYIVDSFYESFGRRLQELGLDVGLPAPLEAAEQAFGCMQCSFAAKTKAGEGAHMFKKHQLCAQERYLMDTTQCRACLKEYHTPSKLQRHLKHATQCREQLAVLPLDQLMPGIGSRAERDIQAAHDDLLPPLQAEGPRPRLRGGRRDLHVDPALRDAIVEVMFPDSPTSRRGDPLLSVIQKTIEGCPVSWTMCRSTLQSIRDELTQEDAELIGHPLPDIHQVFDNLMHTDAWPFLRSDGTGARKHTRRSAKEWEVVLRALSPEQMQACEPSGLRQFTQHRVLLHFFSGRRRYGDLQWYIERTPARPSTTVHVVSIDLVFHATWGNLALKETQKTWLQFIRAGWVVGFLAGPPCSTWSQARGKHIEGRRHAPRILRTAEHPWGLEQLSIRELRALIDGTLLLLYCVQVALEIWHVGGTLLLEHPATPEDVDKASIWRAVALRTLGALSGFELHTLWQGYHGAKSPKPTQLLALNIEGLGMTLSSCSVADFLPAARSIGLGGGGEFQTTSLKEYPPSLNKGLAAALMSAIDASPPRELDIPSHFWSTIAPMQASFGGSMGLDCQV
eukprot:Skav214322  [mRNA]  locus=scaffold86:84509:89755:+ [translate_table: standard]